MNTYKIFCKINLNHAFFANTPEQLFAFDIDPETKRKLAQLKIGIKYTTAGLILYGPLCTWKQLIQTPYTLHLLVRSLHNVFWLVSAQAESAKSQYYSIDFTGSKPLHILKKRSKILSRKYAAILQLNLGTHPLCHNYTYTFPSRQIINTYTIHHTSTQKQSFNIINRSNENPIPYIHEWQPNKTLFIRFKDSLPLCRRPNYAFELQWAQQPLASGPILNLPYPHHTQIDQNTEKQWIASQTIYA